MTNETSPCIFLKDIAEYVGMHYTTVSKVIKRIEGEDKK
jgi:DNA-binding MarR family transcriptional regulator